MLPRRIKPDPNREVQLEILRAMTDEQRLAIACDLSDMTRAMLKQNLRELHPELSEEALHDLYLKHLSRWYNKSY